MGAKETVLIELEAVIKEFGLAPSMVGRALTGDPGFMERMRNPAKTITTDTLDKVWHFILSKRGELDLDLDRKKK